MEINDARGGVKRIGELLKNYQPEEAAPVFEKYVHLTSKLINRPYMQTFKLVEDWQTHKIIRRYNECTWDKTGRIRGDVLWWYLRKRDREKDVTSL